MKKIMTAALLLAALNQVSAQAGELTLFSRPDFGGQDVSLRGATSDLNQRDFNDRASSAVVRSGTWEVCEHADFGGRCMILERGEYPTLRRFDNLISSAREIDRGNRGGWGRDRDHDRDDGNRGNGNGNDYGRRGDAVMLFEHARFEGRQVGVHNDVRTLRDFDFNDVISSIIINDGRWEFCNDADFGGQCITYGPGRYPVIDMNDRISSMRRVR
ncbi:beta/gamma crystallin-related protein [Rugamonas sp. CCM 8940]|uniref:beta/gamma crystallin-related protein n=1 Tax=Rugamonas sp. CCM 8940 TaxID=2765359 RepID=UPI0018F40711|nr:beta/gamma crystallin-related protein [Rugamonas sp. CCM 8940]MBJ7311737.1 beta/gamma crystallin family protein [Rugamonas sp. CCM 8940]